MGETWAVIAAAAVAAIGGYGVAWLNQRGQNRQLDRAADAQTTAAEAKGKVDLTLGVLQGWQQMVGDLRGELGRQAARMDALSRELAQCERDKIELRQEFIALEARVAREVGHTAGLVSGDVAATEASDRVTRSGGGEGDYGNRAVSGHVEGAARVDAGSEEAGDK